MKIWGVNKVIFLLYIYVCMNLILWSIIICYRIFKVVVLVIILCLELSDLIFGGFYLLLRNILSKCFILFVYYRVVLVLLLNILYFFL